jgi:hypothetical protein
MAALLAAGCHEPKQTIGLKPSALVDRDALDFGRVPVGEWREAEVRVRNVGFVPFNALEALGLQGNPSFVVEMEPGEVKPQHEKLVKVRFHPLQEGELVDEVRLRVDAPGTEQPVAVRGEGTPTPVRISPARLDFETLEVDSDRTLPITVENPVDLPLTVRLPGDAPFSTSTVTIPPRGSLRLDARYFPRLVREDSVRLEVRACETCTPATAELVGRSVEDAFDFEPEPVGFPATPVHSSSEGRARLRNITWRPVTLTSLAPSDEAFAVEPRAQVAGVVVNPGQAHDVPMRFSARASGPTIGLMEVRYTSDKPRQTSVGLDARGGQPTLAVTPVVIDVGEVPVGGKVDRGVQLTNAGSQGDLRFTAVRATGDVSQFGVMLPRRNGVDVGGFTGTWPALTVTNPLVIRPAGDSLEMRVFFEPTQVGEFRVEVTFESDASYGAARTVVVTGRSRPAGRCTWSMTPAQGLDFGNVPPGWGAVLGFRFANEDKEFPIEECVVKDFRIENDAGGAFNMPGGAITGGVVPQDSAFSFMVGFRAPPGSSEDQVFNGTLVFSVNDPANPVVRLPLRARAVTTCLSAAPNFMDFGPVRLDCVPPERRTVIQNICSTPVTVRRPRIGDGTSEQFSLTAFTNAEGAPIDFPITLLPGSRFEVAAAYERNVLGQHYSPMYVPADGEPVPYMVPLLAETLHDDLDSETFVQSADSQLDVLFVIGNTTTMRNHQEKLSNALPGWLAQARAEGVSLRVGVTSTGLVGRDVCGGPIFGGEAGRLVPVDGSRPRLVDANGLLALQENVRVGACHDTVQGLETMRQALSSPLVDRQDDPRTPQPNDGNLGLVRGTADQAVVVLSDEDDHSGFRPEGYVQFLQSLKGPGGQNRTRLHALVPRGGCTTAGPSAPRLEEVARGTGGEVRNICGGATDYAALLNQLVREASAPTASFRLTERVGDPTQLTVTVNGNRTNNWTFDAGDNAVVFNAGSVPTPGQRITVRYRAVCGP